MQGIYPLPYWTGIILFHAVYAGFELKRFQNFNKYGEVLACSSCTVCSKANLNESFDDVCAWLILLMGM